MKLYLVTRWGNPESEEGPDGEDTHFLVCAGSVERAAALADERLLRMPTQIGKNRPVQPFAHRVQELGTAPRAFKEEIIVCGPWISFELQASWPKGLPSWHREDGRWKTEEEMFGD